MKIKLIFLSISSIFLLGLGGDVFSVAPGYAMQITTTCSNLLIPKPGKEISPYIVQGCSSDGQAKLRRDPSSLEWLLRQTR